ncbi:MAG TPA: DUF2267 domain-containing protein [Nocardioidaceae bacterium]|nr:DUF2267 domain-containing protein [Nocardioidaceae bacterium]
MQYAQIVAAVQQHAPGLSHQEASRLTQATIAVLGERLGGGVSQGLALKLPALLATEIREDDPREEFGVEEFYTRVAAVSPSSPDTPEGARRQARAVAAALRETLPGREYDALCETLPGEYADLLTEACAEEPRDEASRSACTEEPRDDASRTEEASDR